MSDAIINSQLGILAVLCSVAAFWFLVHQQTQWKIFDYIPPLLFIYATPIVLSNTGVIPASTSEYSPPVYAGLSAYVLPAFIVLMLIKVNVPAAVKIMGKGVLVMLMGTAGVMVGAVVSYIAVHQWLAPDAWKGFGALAGSWIGGTANLAATKEMLDTPDDLAGLAILADNVIYVVWLPILLGSRNVADRFNAWTGVSADRLSLMDAAAEATIVKDKTPEMRDYIYLVAIAIVVTWLGAALASNIHASMTDAPQWVRDVFSQSTIRILLITTVALTLSVTPISRLPNATALGTSLIYVFVAGMGARASLSGFAQAPAFLLGAFIWITVHGIFCILGAKLFKVDVHSTAIASAANIGAAASAPIVAAFHRPSLVPVSVLMALLGYAIGNYLAPLTGHLARLAVGQ